MAAPLAAPAFTLSVVAETKTVGTSISGYRITPTDGGGTIASYAISPSAPAGTTFSTSTGLLTGTPTSTQSATAYTITAANATGSAARTFTLTVTAVVYEVGDTGPGGGKIFYKATTPFACGPTRAATCTYLEAARALWNAESPDPNRTWAPFPTYSSTSVGSSGSPETATATEIGWGYFNSRAIILQGNTDSTISAAALADSYTATVSGVIYDDWYLPSRSELNQMCKWQRGNAWTSDATLCTGGTLNSATRGASSAEFLAAGYWSSSEDTALLAWTQSFNTGGLFNLNKYTNLRVRPVRAF
jgi:hypothetical protein